MESDGPSQVGGGGNWEWTGFASFVGQSQVEAPRSSDLYSPLLKNTTTTTVAVPESDVHTSDDVELSMQVCVYVCVCVLTYVLCLFQVIYCTVVY